MLEQIKLNKTFIYLLLGIILLAHTLILTKLIYFPYPEIFIYPYLTNHGLKPYSQILDQHFPGLLFLPINFDNLGMITPEVARIWSISIVLITHIMIFLIASEILKSKKKAILLNILYLIWQPFFEGWVLWIDNLLPLLLLPAFYSLYRKRIFITGLLLGLAIVFKQTVIPLSALILIYIYWTNRNLKLSLRFLLGLLIPVSVMLVYILGIGVFADFWYWTIIFNLTTYAQFGTKAPPSIGFITRVLLVYGVSVSAIFSKEKKVVYALFIFISGLLIGAFERGDFVHSQPLLPFIIFATVVGLSELWNLKAAKLVIIGYLLIGVWWLNIFYRGHLSSGVISFDSQTKSITSKIRELTRPGEKIFVFGAAPQLYQMSGTIPAGDIFVFQFPWFLKVSQKRVLEGIIKDRPNIVVSDRTVNIEGAKIIDFAPDIDQYINVHYRKIDSVGTTNILLRNN